jgi:hypothetical protein
MTFDTLLARLGLMRIDQHLESLTAQMKRDNDIRSHLIQNQAERFAKWRLRDEEDRENYKKVTSDRSGYELSQSIKAVHHTLKAHFAAQLSDVLMAAKVPTPQIEKALKKWGETT